MYDKIIVCWIIETVFCDVTWIVQQVEMDILLSFVFPSNLTIIKWVLFLIFTTGKTIINNLTKTHLHSMCCRRKCVTSTAMCFVKSIAYQCKKKHIITIALSQQNDVYFSPIRRIKSNTLQIPWSNKSTNNHVIVCVLL